LPWPPTRWNQARLRPRPRGGSRPSGAVFPQDRPSLRCYRSRRDEPAGTKIGLMMYGSFKQSAGCARYRRKENTKRTQATHSGTSNKLQNEPKTRTPAREARPQNEPKITPVSLRSKTTERTQGSSKALMPKDFPKARPPRFDPPATRRRPEVNPTSTADSGVPESKHGLVPAERRRPRQIGLQNLRNWFSLTKTTKRTQRFLLEPSEPKSGAAAPGGPLPFRNLFVHSSSWTQLKCQ